MPTLRAGNLPKKIKLEICRHICCRVVTLPNFFTRVGILPTLVFDRVGTLPTLVFDRVGTLPTVVFYRLGTSPKNVPRYKG